MTLRYSLNGTVAVLASVLDLATGIDLVLSVQRSSTVFVLAVLACISYCLLSIVNITSLVITKRQQTFTTRLSFTAIGLAPTLLAGATLTMAILSDGRTTNSVLCPSPVHCPWTHDRAVLTGFMLCLGAGVSQAVYTTTYLTIKHRAALRNTMLDNTPISTPPRSFASMSIRERPPFRYPIIRKNTDEGPFPYEDALRAKSDMPPPESRRSTSSQSARLDAIFIQSHVGDASHNRSWASTLPTLTHTASPRSLHSHPKSAVSHARTSTSAATSERSDFTACGVALGSPTHKSNKENQSISYTNSSTSSNSIRRAKRLFDYRFHLPSSPVSRLDIGDFPKLTPRANTCPINSSPRSSILQCVENDEDDDNVLMADTASDSPGRRSTTTARSRDSPRCRTPTKKGLRLPVCQRLSFSEKTNLTSPTGPSSPDWRRSGIFESLRPRLPTARSPTRASWTGTPHTSPSRQKHSPGKLSVQEDHNAFAEWDTSNVEQDPSYLVSMKDSRDISGASRGTVSSRRHSAESQLSFWRERSGRIGSDGSSFCQKQVEEDFPESDRS